MIEKGKISAFQLAVLIYPTILATAILVVPAITGEMAQHDMVITPIWGALNGLFTAWIGFKLQTYYPNQTMIQYSEQLLGRFLGKVIGFAFLLFLFHITGVIIREYSTFIQGSFLPKTPLLVIESGMILVCAMAVRGGIEVLARSAQIFIPVFIVPLGIMVVLLMNEFHIENLFPLMEHGIKPSLLGAAVPWGWFSEVAVAVTMIPFLKDPQKGLRWGVISILAIMLTLIAVNVTTLLLLENVTTKVTYPVLIVARYISIADFFEHLEATVMAIWITGIFVKLSVFYYVIVLGTAQWLQLSEYRSLVLPVGWIFILLGMWSTPNLIYLTYWLSTIFPFYGTLFFTIVPLLLLIIAFLRKMLESKKAGTKT